MSRTYRRKNAKYLVEECRVLRTLDNTGPWHEWEWIEEDPKSKEGKKRLAKFYSDNPQCIFNWYGPSWFHNLYAQRPYRRECKREIKKYLKDPEYDISLLRRPRSPYFY